MACQYKSRVWENGWCNVACSYCTLTQENTCKHNKQTNADRIRAMSDEELAEYVGKICLCSHIQDIDIKHCDARAVCTNCIVEWLKQPADDWYCTDGERRTDDAAD